MPCCSSLAAIWSMPNENTFAKPRSRYTCSRGCEVVVVWALLMPIDSPSSMSDSTAEGGRCQRRAKHENQRDRVQLPKGFIGFPSDGTISPIKLIVSTQSALFNGSDFGEPSISTSVLGAQHLGLLNTFHRWCLYCRSQVGFVGSNWIAFKGIDEQETRTEQTPSPHQRCPGCKCVEGRLK